MKIQHTITFFLLVAASLTSCEMKDEIFDKNKISGDTGYLNLAVSVQDKATRAATDEGTNNNSPVSADNFEVEINNSEGTYEKKFDSYAELQAAGKIELPVGKYTIKAHTPGTIAPKMDYPFYNGEETLEITKDTEKETTVTCTMQNTKIQLIYGETFATIFKEWDITISDGSSNILTYDESDLNPTVKYWLIADNVSEITVHIVAYLQDGTKITENRSITKPEDADSDFWAGSDALTITMEPGEPSTPDDPNGATINVKVEISFTDDEVTEEIPVEGEGSDEGEGGDTTDPDEGEGPTIAFPKNNYILPNDNGLKADAKIYASAGIESVIVKITPGNTAFEEALGLLPNAGATDEEKAMLDLLTGAELVDNNLLGSTIGMIMTGVNIPELSEKDINYTFPVGDFFDALGSLGTTNTDAHKFEITVKDMNGETTSGVLSVSVK